MSCLPLILRRRRFSGAGSTIPATALLWGTSNGLVWGASNYMKWG